MLNMELNVKGKMLHTNLGVNDEGHLTLAGRDTVELAETYGTPLMLMDEARVRMRMREYTETMREVFAPGSMPLFASKALSCKEMYRIAHSEGMGTDIVSCGELYTANSVGFPMEKAYFHGNNKTDADISYALDCGVGTFICDNREELYALSAQAKDRGITQRVILRVTPGIDPHTHEAINTGKVDSKFGTAIETGQAMELIKELLTLPSLELVGLHCHVGSLCFDSKPFIDAAHIMIAFMAAVREQTGKTLTVLNLGGGYGVRYVESDPEFSIPENLRLVSAEIKKCCSANNFPEPQILLEPGRSIVADAGVTVYTVGSVKTITGYKSYVSVDGGMSDNPRYALYKSDYTVLNASRAAAERDFTATVAGRLCESGDLIGEDMLMAKPQRGDKLAVLVTGAYNYAMSSNYNRVPRPPVVFIAPDGETRVAIRRETFEDVAKLDV